MNEVTAQSPALVSAEQLGHWLRDTRRHTLALAQTLDAGKLLGPKLAIVNPPLWELGHIAWFQEHWCLRQNAAGALHPSLFPDADALYDSAKVAHRTRWDLPLPDLHHTFAYLDAVLERVLERLARHPDDPDLQYFIQLAVFHEDMHGEAFTYTWQTLGYPAPLQTKLSLPAAGPCPGDVSVPGGEFMLGAALDKGFVFDNEKWAHPVKVPGFQIARAPVTNAEFMAFVDDQGYARESLWSEEGWRWRQAQALDAPRYWHQRDGVWYVRVFDQLVVLPLYQPVLHVNWFEAMAYARWAGRRLPTEAEWERAAATVATPDAPKRTYPWGEGIPTDAQANLDHRMLTPCEVGDRAAGDSAWGCRQMLGNVWEWTASPFEPYPGFKVDPYKEYSQPWFGTHKVLRGGSFATPARLMRNTWRNFYTPDRGDIFAGFRTCALD